MSDNPLGKAPTALAGRDAVHIAILSAIAGERLDPGTHVSLRDGKAFAGGHYISPFIGIVDPFLFGTLNEGDGFYILLYPNTITSLRHVWTHPLIPETSLTVIDSVAVVCGYSRERFLEILDSYSESEVEVFDNSERYKEVTQNDWSRVWSEWSSLRKKPVPLHLSHPFYCAC